MNSRLRAYIHSQLAGQKLLAQHNDVFLSLSKKQSGLHKSNQDFSNKHDFKSVR